MGLIAYIAKIWGTDLVVKGELLSFESTTTSLCLTDFFQYKALSA